MNLGFALARNPGSSGKRDKFVECERVECEIEVRSCKRFLKINFNVKVLCETKLKLNNVGEQNGGKCDTGDVNKRKLTRIK